MPGGGKQAVTQRLLGDDAAGRSWRVDEFSLGRGASKSAQVTDRDRGGVELLSWEVVVGRWWWIVADRNRRQYIKP